MIIGRGREEEERENGGREGGKGGIYQNVNRLVDQKLYVFCLT
jgi:hypothetical protein